MEKTNISLILRSISKKDAKDIPNKKELAK